MKNIILKAVVLFILVSAVFNTANACSCQTSNNICQYLLLYPGETFFKVRLDTIANPNPFENHLSYGITVIEKYHGSRVITSNYWLQREMNSCWGVLPYAAQVGDTFLITLNASSGIDTGSLWTCSYIQQIKNDSIYNNSQSAFHINNLQDTIDACGELNAENIDLARAIQIYPNPAREMLHIDNRSGSTLLSLQLFDISGRKVFFSEGKDINTLPLGSISNGLYYLQIRTDKGMLNRKVQIAK